jgi:hypothetical protein
MAESFYTDPRYEALGLTDTTQARAADQFYGSIPQMRGPQGYGMQQQFQDPDDMKMAYEMDIIKGVNSIDPTSPDYEYKVQEYFASQPEETAIARPRVQAAVAAALGRSKLLRSKAQENIKAEQDLLGQLAENGEAPEKIANLYDADGKLNVIRARYELGKLKRTNGKSGEFDPAEWTEKDSSIFIEKSSAVPTEPITAVDSVSRFEAVNGRKPETEEEWRQGYLLEEEARYAPLRNVIASMSAMGKKIPVEMYQQAKMQPPGQQMQAPPPANTPASPSTETPQNPSANQQSPPVSSQEAAELAVSGDEAIKQAAFNTLPPEIANVATQVGVDQLRDYFLISTPQNPTNPGDIDAATRDGGELGKEILAKMNMPYNTQNLNMLKQAAKFVNDQSGEIGMNNVYQTTEGKSAPAVRVIKQIR